jgi:phosphate transport system permease protein
MEARTPGTERTRLAVAGARSATLASITGRQSLRTILRERLFLALLLLAVGIALLGIAVLIIDALIDGRSRLDSSLVTESASRITPEGAGYYNAIIGTLYLIGGVVLLTVPIGVGAAIYLEEYANKERWWNRVIELNIQNLAAVPSIVYGILGLAFFNRGLGFGGSVLAVALTLSLLVLPIVIISCREAIRAIPTGIREGALALGATRLQTVRRTILPNAIPGTATGSILALSRAIGEAAPVLLVAGGLVFITFNPTGVLSQTTVLPVQIFNYVSRPQEEFRIVAAAAIMVLLIILLVMNSAAIMIRNKFQRKW